MFNSTKIPCPEDPKRLCGQPIGQYHCPYCGCMQVACTPHSCDPGECLLEDCDCLPDGVHQSPNLKGWLESGREPLCD
jgi:hypothetical protein